MEGREGEGKRRDNELLKTREGTGKTTQRLLNVHLLEMVGVWGAMHMAGVQVS